MRYVAAYLLAVLGGNASPKKKDIESILGSVGIEAEADKIDLLLKQLAGKNIEEVMEAGKEKLAAVPSGGAVAVSAGGAGGAADDAKEEKKEEKKEESEEESDDD